MCVCVGEEEENMTIFLSTVKKIQQTGNLSSSRDEGVSGETTKPTEERA